MIAPLWILGLILYMFCLASIGRNMPLLVYLSFGLCRTICLMTVAFFYPDHYWDWYWPLQGAGYVLSALLAVSILMSVTRSRFRRIDLMVIGALVVLLPFMVCWGAQEWHPWMAVAKWVDVAMMWALLFGMTARVWPQPQEGLAWGLILGAAGHVGCALIQGDKDPGSWLRAGYQVAGIIQLSVWLWVFRRERVYHSELSASNYGH